MTHYRTGMDVLGAIEVKQATPLWHHIAIAVGALASVATLWSVARSRGK